MRTRSHSDSVSGPCLSQMRSTTPARPRSCRCAARVSATRVGGRQACAGRARRQRRHARPNARACSATSCRRTRPWRGWRSRACRPPAAPAGPGSAASTASTTDGTSSTANSCGGATTEHVDQLRVVAAAGALADQRHAPVDCRASAAPPGRRPPAGRPAPARSIASPLSRAGRPLPVPALEHLVHAAHDRRRQTQALRQQLAHLAVSPRHRRHAGQVPERAQHLARPPQRGR